MAITYKWTATGYQVSNEKCMTTGTVVISTVTYYVFPLNSIPNRNIYNAAVTTNGVWTATSKGGTRRTVVLDGLPTGDDVLVVLNGIFGFPDNCLVSRNSADLYAYYTGHGSAYRGDVVYDIPNTVIGAEASVKTLLIPEFKKAGRITISINGDLPSQEATFTITNSEYASTVSFPVADNFATVELSDWFKIYPGNNVLSTLNGYGISNFHIYLEDLKA